METLGALFPDGEWECFGRMFATEEHYDSPQLLGQTQSSLLLGEDDGNFGVLQSMFCSTPETGGNKRDMFYSFDSHNSTLQYISQQSSHSHSSKNYYFDYPDHVVANNSDRSENSDHIQVDPIAFQAKQLKLKRMLDVPELVENKIINSCGIPKKKTRASKDEQKCVKNAESKKSQKVDRNGKESEETNASADGHSTSSYYTSEEHEENSVGATLASKLTVALNSNGKTRASRGSATDPQSLYARKRRERINERLRILQNLVPNGTKVDISTMLEEAIHYVKFLQLQIKLLSSDDLWMYSPIAYNGLDIGLSLSQKISPPL